MELPEPAAKKLAEYQAEVNSKPTFLERKEAAKILFSRWNKKGNPTFDKIKEVLCQICSGVVRCVYCEDSKADEVEHFEPKDCYPEMVFVWENLLYGCGPCNGSTKNNKFAIFLANSIQLLHLACSKSSVPPPTGEKVLINPRKENPMDFLMLDILDTFFFAEIHEEGTKEYVRANYTIEVLGLN